ncbi:hypothetical protein DMUE_2067 [Dictyocoela muelleri]|nr:hypothetical protein DMUE_2067 [Dictyocoela muelleri]
MQKWALYAAELMNMRNNQLLFFDESGFNPYISNNYGYSIKNTDAVISVSHSRRRNISLCAILSTSGIIDYKLVDGLFKSEMFCNFIQGCVTKRNITNDTLIIWDNASIHHTRQVKETLDENEVPLKYFAEYILILTQYKMYFLFLKAKFHLEGQ